MPHQQGLGHISPGALPHPFWKLAAIVIRLPICNGPISRFQNLVLLSQNEQYVCYAAPLYGFAICALYLYINIINISLALFK